MLTHLAIRNFAIVSSVEMELTGGMTTITGETGAGKSIALDALGLCLGERAEASMVRPGCEKAELIATFSVEHKPKARQWLQDNELLSEDECILRRVISSEGRSRAFINGRPVPLTQLRQLGEMLVHIYGQHAHLELLKHEQQRDILDRFGQLFAVRDQVRQAYRHWQRLQKELTTHQQQRAQQQDKQQLLAYQVAELDEFALAEDEYEQLVERHNLLANAQQLMQDSQHALQLLTDAEPVNCQTLLQQVRHQLADMQDLAPSLQSALEMLESAAIQVDEASNELQHFSDNLELDPEQLVSVEQRMESALDLARKHQVRPEALYQHHQQLLAELAAMTDAEQDEAALVAAVAEAEQDYLLWAKKLSGRRQQAGKRLARELTREIRQLNLPHAQCDIQLTEQNAAAEGIDKVELLLCTNPGQPLEEVAKVASGGELSRIGLALQVLSAVKGESPSLVFDEVDVGISGPTAAVVGRMLRQLGEHTQLLCVTHLPQVAGYGHHQWFVDKSVSGRTTETHVAHLDREARVRELARLLGGDKVTDNTLANAQELLFQA